MRPLSDGPYEIVTYLQRPHAQADSVLSGSSAERWKLPGRRCVAGARGHREARVSGTLKHHCAINQPADALPHILGDGCGQ